MFGTAEPSRVHRSLLFLNKTMSKGKIVLNKLISKSNDEQLFEGTTLAGFVNAGKLLYVFFHENSQETCIDTENYEIEVSEDTDMLNLINFTSYSVYLFTFTSIVELARGI